VGAAVTDAPDVLLDGGYLPVSAELIENRLNDIWKQGTSAPGEQRLVKLCLANILIVADAAGRIEAEHLARQLATRQPSRVMLLVIDEELQSYGAFVRTACEYRPDLESYVCWEMVEILSDTARAGNTAGAIRSLLVDAVPVITADFRKFQTTPSFDADLWEMSDYYFVQAEVVPVTPHIRGYMPLAWYRTLPIRELLGSSIGCIAQQGKSIQPTKITVHFALSHERLDPLLAAWLVKRLADNGQFTAQGATVRFSHRWRAVELVWEKTEPDDNRVLEILFDDGLALVISGINGASAAAQFQVSHPAFNYKTHGVGIDLAQYLLAASGNNAEFAEFADVQKVSVALPIP
jgi:hypothetical protein